MKTLRVIDWVSGLVVLACALAAVCFWMLHARASSTVMTKPSPDQQHSATLVRDQLIDVNFSVKVDGRSVYRSPDFAVVRADYREHLVWDKNSHLVILEVAGTRLFGYHVLDKRPLTAEELSAVEYAPFDALRFEGVPVVEKESDAAAADRRR